MIKQKDTLSKVAKRFGVTLEDLLAANPDIKNPDKISIGQQIIIPLPVEDGAGAVGVGRAVAQSARTGPTRPPTASAGRC